MKSNYLLRLFKGISLVFTLWLLVVGIGLSSTAAQPEAAAATEKWTTLLCKFSDVADEPQPKAFFKDMFERTSGPSLSTVWNEISYGEISGLTTDVYGWYTLPRARAGYNFSASSRNYDFAAILQDCADAASADVSLGFGDKRLVMVNSPAPFAIAQIGGDGAVLPSNKWNLSTIPHEMGHVYGWVHSLAGVSQTTNPWDLMGANRYNCGVASDPVYGCIGQHPAAAHKDQSGYFPDDRVKQVDEPGTYTFALERLAQPTNGNPLFIKVQNSKLFKIYTIEARKQVGLDKKLTADGVIIHERVGSRVSLVDGDGNGDYTDGGTVWLPGEQFVVDGMMIKVDSETSTGYVVTIVLEGSLPPTLSASTAPNNVQADDIVTVTVKLKNGGSPLTNAMLVASVPPSQFAYVTGSETTSIGTVTYTETGGDPRVVVDLGDVAPDQTGTLTFQVKIDSGITNPTALSAPVELTWDGDRLISGYQVIVNGKTVYLPVIVR